MKRWYNYPRYKPDDPCRFCDHRAVFHLDIQHFGTGDQIGRWDKCDKPPTNTCDCPGFAPVDNLEYLEEKHEETI